MGNCTALLCGTAASRPSSKRSHPRSCVFCDIAEGRQQQKTILYQDERLMVFPDIRPAAAVHLQVIPRRHIKNLSALRPCEEDAALVEEMWERGWAVLQELRPGAQYSFGFHRPPFNSVQHLHLHCIALPHAPWRAWKYSNAAPWWLDVRAALRQLRPAGAAGSPDSAV